MQPEALQYAGSMAYFAVLSIFELVLRVTAPTEATAPTIGMVRTPGCQAGSAFHEAWLRFADAWTTAPP